MNDNIDRAADPDPAPDPIVGDAVRIFPGTDRECRGVITDDFGEVAGCGVDIGAIHIADAARRWAVTLDDGGLVFVDGNDIAVQPGGK